MVLYTLLPSPKRVTIRLSSPSLFNEIVPVPERKKTSLPKDIILEAS